MDKINKTVVRICGADYPVVSDRSEEYMQRVAFFVDRKMSEIKERNSKLSTNMTAVLTAINLADENFENRELIEAYRLQIKQYVEQSNRDKMKISELAKKNEQLLTEIQRLKIEYAKIQGRK